jgi:TolB-like protein/Tfp pilus assembly protein PilF
MTVIALSLFTGRAEAIDSIAVLPLENLTGDAEQEYFVDGVTDELIGQLAQISALRVISRRSVMRYKESDKSLPEIARELNVDAVVEGTVHRIGESVRIRVQLIDALPEEQNLWAETYDRAMTDVLAMYGEMARAIVGEIKVKLTAEEETHFATARQVNPEAYEAYLKGWFHKDKMTSPDLETALKYFELALEKDPNFARAYVGISGVWGTRTQMGLLPPHEAMPQAKAAAEKAVELDDTLAEVHHKLAGIRTWGDWDWEGAEKAFRRAIGINPSYPDVRSAYSHFLHIMRRPDEAMVQIERALELDPFNAKIQAFYGFDLLFLRQYDDAIEQFQNTLKTVPNHPLAHSGLLSAFYAKRMYEEALAEVRFFAEGDREYEDALARGYKEGGFPGAMNLSAELLAARSRTTYVSPSDIAILYAYAGKYDQAFEWLERGFEEHDPNMPYNHLIPAFEPLCNDSRFKDLLRRMNLPELQ